MDGVEASLLRAAVAARGAARGSTGLSRGVGNKITTVAAILESVVQIKPMADLVNEGAAQVVRSLLATRDSLSDDNASVTDEGGAVGSNTWLGEEAVTKSLISVQLGDIDEVSVEGLVVALSQLGLHGDFAIASGPAAVDSEVGANKLEGNAVGAVSLVQELQLLLQLVILI